MSKKRIRHPVPILPSSAECAEGCRLGQRCIYWHAGLGRCDRTRWLPQATFDLVLGSEHARAMPARERSA